MASRRPDQAGEVKMKLRRINKRREHDRDILRLVGKISDALVGEQMVVAAPALSLMYSQAIADLADARHDPRMCEEIVGSVLSVAVQYGVLSAPSSAQLN